MNLEKETHSLPRAIKVWVLVKSNSDTVRCGPNDSTRTLGWYRIKKALRGRKGEAGGGSLDLFHR